MGKSVSRAISREIETFLGPAMATSKASAFTTIKIKKEIRKRDFNNIKVSMTCSFYDCYINKESDSGCSHVAG